MRPIDLAYILLAGVTAPVWMRKARGGWPERFGKGPALQSPGEKPRVLLHAVSVGEVNALRTLVPLLEERAEVVIASWTDTGIERARKVFGDRHEIVRYPLDFSWSVRRMLDRVRPDAVGLVELELWPNFVRACARRGVPVCVINGRLSAKSFGGYRRIRRFVGPSFASLSFAAVQDEAYAERFEQMGVRENDCLITGTMKWDTAVIEDEVAGAAELAEAMGIDRSRPLVVAGSTAEGEEALLHKSVPEGVQLLCAPRHPPRFDEAAAALPGCVRRSAGGVAGEDRDAGPDRFLLDSIGELRAAYSLADAVVVGRSFVPKRGSDPIEPVGLGKATLIGPSFENFDSVVRTLCGAGAIKVVDREFLAGAIRGLLDDPETRRAMAEAGRRTIREHQGASERHAELLVSLGLEGMGRRGAG